MTLLLPCKKQRRQKAKHTNKKNDNQNLYFWIGWNSGEVSGKRVPSDNGVNSAEQSKNDRRTIQMHNRFCQGWEGKCRNVTITQKQSKAFVQNWSRNFPNAEEQCMYVQNFSSQCYSWLTNAHVLELYPQRFNVAMTRAQALLIVVGDPRALRTDPIWNK